MKNIWRFLFIVSQIFAYILGIILVIQILKLILGGSWRVEDVLLAIGMTNITLTFALMGYIITSNNSLNNNLSQIDKKLHGHLEWHRGKDN